ncbi:hypothetical protein DESUT3_29260 [Desulfuromonas versatilis]|uniref:Uncharacterized protein n=1 Tax=Desulfuromonas versatilis TaxID=2802975 RepID=A0ABN6E102_9BACT|nr:hypothetical protein [Desulfuromonas versatilis]BCR05857.1 hypothetical protein DESUT3_29260 [Desulfuromonas versatilis]
MKKLALGLLIVTMVAGCLTSGHTNQSASGSTRPESQEIMEFAGTVVFVPLEGGFYGILDDSGKRFDPHNLPEQMRQDGLRVQVKARPVTGAVGFHMWGTIVEILEIHPK